RVGKDSRKSVNTGAACHTGSSTRPSSLGASSVRTARIGPCAARAGPTPRRPSRTTPAVCHRRRSMMSLQPVERRPRALSRWLALIACGDPQPCGQRSERRSQWPRRPTAEAALSEGPDADSALRRWLAGTRLVSIEEDEREAMELIVAGLADDPVHDLEVR